MNNLPPLPKEFQESLNKDNTKLMEPEVKPTTEEYQVPRAQTNTNPIAPTMESKPEKKGIDPLILLVVVIFIITLITTIVLLYLYLTKTSTKSTFIPSYVVSLPLK